MHYWARDFRPVGTCRAEAERCSPDIVHFLNRAAKNQASIVKVCVSHTIWSRLVLNVKFCYISGPPIQGMQFENGSGDEAIAGWFPVQGMQSGNGPGDEAMADMYLCDIFLDSVVRDLQYLSSEVKIAMDGESFFRLVHVDTNSPL